MLRIEPGNEKGSKTRKRDLNLSQNIFKNSPRAYFRNKFAFITFVTQSKIFCDVIETNCCKFNPFE